MIETTTFQRKTFRVKAVQVTEENLDELAKWCGGAVRLEPIGMDGFKPYVEVTTCRVPTARISRHVKDRAYVGDWITRLSDANNFRVYRNKSFKVAFEKLPEPAEKLDVIVEILADFVADRDDAMNQADMYSVHQEAAKKIVALFQGGN